MPTYLLQNPTAVFVLALLCPFAANAQRAQISGIILDQRGSVIPGASIELKNDENGAIRTTTSTGEGNYTVPSLSAGEYSLRAGKAGFRTLERTGLRLPVDTNVRLDLTLEIGEVAETIRVNSEAPLLAETAEIGTNVTQREYERLPLVQIGRMRSPASFVFLSAGVQGTVRLDGTDNTSASNHVNVHGASNRTSEIWIEGLPAGQQDGNFNESAPSVDAVREFRLLSSQLAAEYGNTGAAVTSFTLKSGSNELHGTAFDYFRNDKLDARSWLAEQRAPVRLNEFGVTAGGPLWLPKIYNGRDRTFFFFSYGGSRKRGLDQFRLAQIPTPANLAGDFSQLQDSSGRPVVIYDPATTRTENGATVRDPFPGNRIPATRFDTAARRIAGYFPTPNTSQGSLNFGRFTGEQILDPNAWTGKMDHALSERQRISFALIHTLIPRLRIDNPYPEPLTNGIRQNITAWTLRGSHDYAFSPSVLNVLYVGYNRFRNPVGPPIEGQDWSSLLGIPGIGNRAFPQVNFAGGYTGLGAGPGIDNVDWTGLVKDNVSWVRGKHSVRFGGEWRFNQLNNRDFGQTNGVFTINNLYTASPGSLATSGNSVASFLLGGVQQVSARQPFASGQRKMYAGLFAQDEWRVSSALTLTFGLRWEMQTAPYENHDRLSGVDLNAPNPGAGGRPGALQFAGEGTGRLGSRTLTDPDFSAIGPRFGFAWRALSRTVLRGGYGVYYNSNYTGISSLGFNAATDLISGDNGLTPARLLSAGLPPLQNAVNVSPDAANGLSATYYEQSSAAMPRSQNWSFTIQHQLSESLSAEASYVGLHATRQRAEQLTNVNQVDPKFLSLGSLLTRQANSAEAIAAGIALPYPAFRGTVAQALRPFPQYQTLTSDAAKIGMASYHALELRIRKRFRQGLSMEGNYTWSKNIGYPDLPNIAFGGVANYLQNHYDLRAERSLMPNDLPHAFVLQYVYDLPFGTGRFAGGPALVRALARGWSVSAVHRYQSGTPLQLLMNNTLPLFNRVLRPDVVAGAKLSSGIGNADFQPSTDRIVNRAAFAAPGAFRFGNSAPTYASLRNFPVLQEDLAVTKQVRIKESLSLEIYGQAYNALNRHRFANFDTNFSSAGFGQARSTNLPRFIQLGMRIKF
ncbi:MAG: TonB-dependent receptor [Bryobacteraceae bacterium]|nr:TonB-dependent receptor [Bryobacteraceae bacterium]